MVFLNYFFTLFIFVLIILAAEEIGGLFLKAFRQNFQEGFEKRILNQGIGLGFLAIYIFFIGLAGLLKPLFIWLPIIVFTPFVLKNVILSLFLNLEERGRVAYLRKRKGEISILIFIGLIIINLIGVFAPEIGFDALYYHLSLPKIYLMKGRIFRLRGLFDYVSSWPKLTEMLYLFGISVDNSSLARLFHFYFGLMTTFLIFFFSRKFLNRKVGILAGLAFYSMPAISWLSTSGYVDLTLVFYVTLALCLIFYLADDPKLNILIGLIFGFALGAKVLALAYLPGFLLALFLKKKTALVQKTKDAFLFFAGFFGTALPWLLTSFFWTGNPIYPYFQLAKFGGITRQGLFGIRDNIFFRFFYNLQTAFFKPDDYLTPLPLIFLPLTLFYFRKSKKDVRFLGLLVFCLALVWSVFISQTTRYFLPIFPLLIVFSLAFYIQTTKPFVKKFAVFMTFFVSGFCLIYRTVAILPRVKVFLGLEKQNAFLTKHFPKEELVFIDKENFFNSLNIKKENPILIIGTHQLFYVDFPFEHISWAAKDKIYSYILVQGRRLPEEFGKLSLVYKDAISDIKLYKYDRNLIND